MEIDRQATWLMLPLSFVIIPLAFQVHQKGVFRRLRALWIGVGREGAV